MPGFNLNLSDFPHSFIAPHPPPAFVIPLHELPVPQLSHAKLSFLVFSLLLREQAAELQRGKVSHQDAH